MTPRKNQYIWDEWGGLANLVSTKSAAKPSYLFWGGGESRKWLRKS